MPAHGSQCSGVVSEVSPNDIGKILHCAAYRDALDVTSQAAGTEMQHPQQPERRHRAGEAAARAGVAGFSLTVGCGRRGIVRPVRAQARSGWEEEARAVRNSPRLLMLGNGYLFLRLC